MDDRLRRLLGRHRVEATDREIDALIREYFMEKADSSEKDEPKLTSADTAAVLRLRYAEFEKEHSFHPGQLVKWKKGLRNKKRPKGEEPAIVIAVATEPVVDASQNAATPYFLEPLDLIIPYPA